MNIKSRVRRKLVETKLVKESSLIRESVVKKRIYQILKPVSHVENFYDIPLTERKRISKLLFIEIHRYHQSSIIVESEGLLGMFENIFGNLGFSALEGLLIEPLVNTLLAKLGLSGFFKDFLVSFISTNPERVMEAFKSCESMTKLIAEALAEAVGVMIQKKTGAEGPVYDVIRNLLGKSVKETSFIQGIESEVSKVICGVFDKLIQNTEKVQDKLGELKTSVTSTIQPA